MNGWLPIETAPKDKEFLAANSDFFGTGSFHRHVEPDKIFDAEAFQRFREEALRPCGEVPWTPNHLFAKGFDYLAWTKRRDALWESKKHEAPDCWKANPKAGAVSEWFYALAFHSFVGKETDTDDGSVGFTPTHWMPLPERPTPAS